MRQPASDVLFPCNECCKAIIQSGIKEVVYLSDKYAATDSTRASKRMFAAAGVHYRQLETDIGELPVKFSLFEEGMDENH